jgi:glutamine amidotransferase
MCRHLAYLGPPRRIGELLVDPPYGLVRQSWAPRRQRHGAVNVDGFGVGWYADGQVQPARHRGCGPVWADETFADLARVISARVVLAAVRSATPGMPPGADAAAPLRRGPWLFSHNGRLDGWPEAAGPLAARLSPGQLLGLDTASDSGLLWALVRDLLERGSPPGPALAEVVAAAREVAGSRLNLLLTDGVTVAATAAGDTLWWRELPGGSALGRPVPGGSVSGGPVLGGPVPGEVVSGEVVSGGVVVASEPYDDDPAWQEVPDQHLLVAAELGVTVEPL